MVVFEHSKIILEIKTTEPTYFTLNTKEYLFDRAFDCFCSRQKTLLCYTYSLPIANMFVCGNCIRWNGSHTLITPTA